MGDVDLRMRASDTSTGPRDVPTAAGNGAWSRAVRVWYGEHARGLLAGELELLGPLPALTTAALEIGVLGLTGVGKSSLLNAVVAPGTQLLPAGGVGPLTGVPIRIVAAKERELRVRYRAGRWLLETMRALRGAHRLGSDDLGRMSLVCTGDQYRIRDPEWLLDAIRYALHPDVGSPPDGETSTLEALHRLHAVLEHRESTVVWAANSDEGAFFRAVREHTAGQFAPLCEAIEIGWTSSFLRAGPPLIDLPGLGAVHDTHASHTAAWLTRGRVAVLVVDRAGLPEAMAVALRASGFLKRWIDEEAELAIAITKLDLVADDERRSSPHKPWEQHYFDACQRAIAQMRTQLATLLSHAQTDGVDSERAARTVSRARIIPVSSRERHRLEQDDGLDRSRVRSPESTGVPELQRAMLAMFRLGDPLAREIDLALRTTARAHDVELRDDWKMFMEQEDLT